MQILKKITELSWAQICNSGSSSAQFFLNVAQLILQLFQSELGPRLNTAAREIIKSFINKAIVLNLRVKVGENWELKIIHIFTWVIGASMSIELIFARDPRDCPLAGREGRRLLSPPSPGRSEDGAVLFGGIVSDCGFTRTISMC